jgi:hypothetical protein
MPAIAVKFLALITNVPDDRLATTMHVGAKNMAPLLP